MQCIKLGNTMLMSEVGYHNSATNVRFLNNLYKNILDDRTNDLQTIELCIMFLNTRNIFTLLTLSDFTERLSGIDFNSVGQFMLCNIDPRSLNMFSSEVVASVNTYSHIFYNELSQLDCSIFECLIRLAMQLTGGGNMNV